MASPIYEGSCVSAPFINQHINIIHENIFITPKPNLIAFYKIEYQIESLEDGIDIPFIFYAMDYSGEINILKDGVKIQVDSVVDVGNKQDFEYAIDAGDAPSNYINFSFAFRDNEGLYASDKDLKFFTTNLPKGKHVIVVEYNSTVWLDLSDWVKEYSFRYSLSPAKKWKSFGTLDVYVDCTEFGEEFISNLESGLVKDDNVKPLVSHYHFNKIPADFISLTWTPDVNFFADALVFVGPFGLMILLLIGVIVYHIILIRKYRKNNLKKRFSVVVIVGSLIVPLIPMSSLFFFFLLLIG
ncbi:MAG: hypothetical protein ACO3EE_06265 [Flavobacteriales bacterium]